MTILITFRYIFKDDTKFNLTNDPRLKRKCRENNPSMKSMGEINLNVPAKKNKCLNFFFPSMFCTTCFIFFVKLKDHDFIS